MDDSVIELRALSYAINMTTDEFAEEIGISKRQFERYICRHSDGVPTKVLNSARWVYLKRMGNEGHWEE